jgi:outer membrane protein OmpA-like peptidoglycan-associated protein
MNMLRYSLVTLIAAAVLAGCASAPENAMLDEARAEYRSAENNPSVVKHAQHELKLAGDALAQANNAMSKNESDAMVTHLAYVAKQRTSIAVEVARQKSAEEVVAGSALERSQIRLDARTQEVDRLAAELKELNVKTTERGLVLTIGDVLFDTNKAELKAGADRSLQKLANFLQQYPQRKVEIEGHTDSTGSAAYNLQLSERRANAVRSSLVGLGVSSNRITTRGLGQNSPVASNATAAGRQLNRRVEIILPN